MKKVIYVVIAICLLVGLPMYLGLKEKKEKIEKKAKYEASSSGRFQVWQDSLDVVITDLEKDTLEIFSFDPLEECAIVIVTEEEKEIMNFKYVGEWNYQVNISQSSIISKVEYFCFIITRQGKRQIYKMSRRDFVKEFPCLAPTLTLNNIDTLPPL